MKRLCLFSLVACSLTGCGQTSSHLPVTGIVKFSDGTVPKGDIASITFQPTAAGPGTKGASGNIGADGSFELRTVKPGDGALPGDYRVTVHVMQGYPDGKSMVADIYTRASATPLNATVAAGAENHFDFTVERP
ncbi:MAG: hypothetical protein WD851_03320 [Pirellulales bacterium]